MKRGWDRYNKLTMGLVRYTSYEQHAMSIKPRCNAVDYRFFADEEEFIKSDDITLSCPDETGTYYWYFDTNGELQCKNQKEITQEIFVKSAITGLAYYNKDMGIFYGAEDEQHGFLDPEMHLYLHKHNGLMWDKGGNILDISKDKKSFRAISEMIHSDEDISLHLNELNAVASLYRVGDKKLLGDWNFTRVTNYFGHKLNNKNKYIMYNVWDGNKWSLKELTKQNPYALYFFLRTNLSDAPYVRVIGQDTYPTKKLAMTSLKEQINRIELQDLPSAEWEWQYAYIIDRNGVIHANECGKCFLDLRGVRTKNLMFFK